MQQVAKRQKEGGFQEAHGTCKDLMCMVAISDIHKIFSALYLLSKL